MYALTSSPGNHTRLALVSIPRCPSVGWKEQLPALSSEDLGLLFYQLCEPGKTLTLLKFIHSFIQSVTHSTNSYHVPIVTHKMGQLGWALSAVEGQICDSQDTSQGESVHPLLTSRVKLPKAQGLSS